jgi:hypothetical protein
MKTIPNETTDLPKSPTEPTSTTGDIIMFALNQSPQGGYDLATLRARSRVAAVIDKSTETLSFEDADLETVKAAVRACRWPWRHASVLKLADDLGI